MKYAWLKGYSYAVQFDGDGQHRPEYIEAMHQKGRILWGNAILYDYKEPLSAGHTDDVSLTQSPAQGWGWLVDHGFDIIQTDWAWQCCQYLRESGVKR